MNSEKYNDIVELINKHIPIKTAKKVQHGEVFTPLHMILYLLDQFSAAVWKKDTTWFDPAAGIGNFPVCIFFKLMDELKSSIPNETRRAEHIIEKQLFMAELDAENVEICKNIFRSLCPTATPNIAQINTLDHFDGGGFKYSGFPTKFDVVIGNPPYNIGGTAREGTKRAHIAFTKMGLAALAADGYLSYICPPNYREAGSVMFNLFKEAEGHFNFIKVYSPEDTFRHFRIQARVDSFIYSLNPSGPTTIIDEYEKKCTVQIKFDRHIPNFGHTIFEKLWGKVGELGAVKAFRTTEKTSVRADLFGCGKHKILHLIIARGLRIYKSSSAHSLEGVPKLLVNGLGIPYVFHDKAGEYGPSQTPLVVTRPSNNLVKFCQSPLFQAVAWGLRLTGNNNLAYLFDYVPEFSTVKELDLQKFFGLTGEEMAFVEKNFPVPAYESKELVEPCVRRSAERRHTRRRPKKS